MADKPHMNLVIIGHVDHGKSTMTGHMLYLAGAIDERTIQKYGEEAEKIGRGTWKYAWVLDKLAEERERGVTIDVAFYKFETQKYVFTIIDAPGHRDFVKNMITGTSQADAAVLVVSAATGQFEAGIGKEGQTREHAVLAITLGVNQLIVAVNKMDAIDFSEDRYNEIKDELTRHLKIFGYKDLDKVPFIPTSGTEGDNLKDKSPNTPWYKGPTMLKALDQLIVPKLPTDKPLRLPIQDVYTIKGIGTVPVGRVESGILKPGDEIIINPGGFEGQVNSIEMHYEEVPEAIPGSNIGFNIKALSRNDVQRGYVLGHKKSPPTVCTEFTAQVQVIRHPSVISVGYTPVMHAHTLQVATTFVQLMMKMSKTGKEENPEFLKNGDGAVVKMRATRPICVEKFSDFGPLGRFAIRDMGQTVAVGVIQEIDG